MLLKLSGLGLLRLSDEEFIQRMNSEEFRRRARF